jgi:hypothetical protein
MCLRTKAKGILVVLASLMVLSAAAKAADAPLVRFELEDYQGAVFTRERWVGSRLVMFLAGREGTKFNKDYVWTLPVVGHMRGLNTAFVSVADVRGVPRFVRAFARGMFEPESSDPVGLTLLDWDGSLFEVYDLHEDAFHLLVFSSQHRLVYKDVLKEFDEGKLSEVLALIDEALREE